MSQLTVMPQQFIAPPSLSWMAKSCSMHCTPTGHCCPSKKNPEFFGYYNNC